MIRVHDNRKENQYHLHSLTVGKFFMINNILYRKCSWEVTTFESILFEDDCYVCMNMTDGELVVLRREQLVEYIPDEKIELCVED